MTGTETGTTASYQPLRNRSSYLGTKPYRQHREWRNLDHCAHVRRSKWQQNCHGAFMAHTLNIRGCRQLSRNALTSRYVSRDCITSRTFSAVNLPAYAYAGSNPSRPT